MQDSARTRAYLDAMGVTRWVRRSAAPAAANIVRAGEVFPDRVRAPQTPRADDQLDWETLATRVAACTLCALHQGRTQTVFGVGDRAAEWLVIGEAPGAEEDKRGEPFVGRAGQLLNSMLAALGLARSQIYIANILKCRPPANRDPQASEVTACEPYLLHQIALIRPKIILAVGRIAAQNLLKVQTPIGKLRGQRHVFGADEIPLVVTYHPAYLLRSPSEKRRAWQDLRFAQQVLLAQP